MDSGSLYPIVVSCLDKTLYSKERRLSPSKDLRLTLILIKSSSRLLFLLSRRLFFHCFLKLINLPIKKKGL